MNGSPLKFKFILNFIIFLLFSFKIVVAGESLKSIQEVLKNDFLEKEAKEKEEELKKQLAEQKVEEDKTGHYYPTEKEIWTLFSQLWLMKHSTQLHWDFKNAQLGILETAKDLFVKLGLIGKTLHILIIDNPNYAHGALPYGTPLNSLQGPSSSGEEYLFFVSLPFIRSMNLSTLEVAMLILEDYFRIELGVFKSYAKEEKWFKNLGTNFYPNPPDVSFIPQCLERYDQFFQTRGYTISEERSIFQSMKNILQTDTMKLLLVYQETLKKINDLITTNSLYSYYSRWYPSPYLKLSSWNTK